MSIDKKTADINGFEDVCIDLRREQEERGGYELTEHFRDLVREFKAMPVVTASGNRCDILSHLINHPDLPDQQDRILNTLKEMATDIIYTISIIKEDKKDG